MPTFYKIFPLIFKYKLRITGGIVCMFFYALFTVAPAKFMKDIVDGLSSGDVPSQEKFLLVGLGIVLLFLFKGFFFFGQNYLMSSIGQKMTLELRSKLFNRLLNLPLAFFNKAKRGDLMSRFTSDLHLLSEAVKIAIAGPMRDFPQILMLLGLMLYRSWQLFLLILVLLPIAAVLIANFGQRNLKVTSKRQSKFGDLTSLVVETISGIRIVKAFNMEPYEIKRFDRENQRLFSYFLHSVKINAYSFPILELIGGICGALMLTYGGYLILHGEMTGGDFASFLVAFFMMNEPIKKFNGFTLKLQEAQAAAIRVFEILEEKTTIVEKENPVELPDLAQSIQIQLNSFAYGEKQVLGKIDMTLKAGTITALVGASGSGKTTLANLIPRFYDLTEEQGKILIDGVDIRDASLGSLRRQIAIVTQEIILFNDTLAHNIGYGDVGCKKEDLQNAAKAAYAHDFIQNFENGFDQVIGEGGVMLSGGQRQRISIARALIKNAPLLILDEATSALDSESEKEVQAAISNLMKNRTSLVIAHRLSTIQHADVIHVFNDGQIVESGKHAELLKKDGEYKRLYDMQFRHHSEPIVEETPLEASKEVASE